MEKYGSLEKATLQQKLEVTAGDVPFVVDLQQNWLVDSLVVVAGNCWVVVDSSADEDSPVEGNRLVVALVAGGYPTVAVAYHIEAEASQLVVGIFPVVVFQDILSHMLVAANKLKQRMVKLTEQNE